MLHATPFALERHGSIDVLQLAYAGYLGRFHGNTFKQYEYQLGELDVDPEVIQSLLGHATAAQSGEYRRIHRGPKLAAIKAIEQVLPFNPQRAG